MDAGSHSQVGLTPGYHYSVSDGPGTLIEHGVTQHYGVLRKVQQRALRSGHTCIFQWVKG